MNEDRGAMYIYCVGESSYDAGERLPDGVFSTLELAQASVAMKPGDAWFSDRGEWWVERPGADSTDDVMKIRRYKLDPSQDEHVSDAPRCDVVNYHRAFAARAANLDVARIASLYPST